MSDRVCIRGCAKPDVHYATCNRRRPEYQGDFPCTGCAPRECRDGSLICDKCFGRMKGLLHDAPDLLGRLRAIADPAKSGWNWDQVVISSGASTTAPPPIGDDLADAIIAIEQALTGWLAWNGDLEWISNNLDAVTWMSARVLEVHRPDEHGVREGWSVLDAVKRWGIERRENGALVYPVDEEDRAEIVEPVTEWFDRLITVKEAAERHKVSQQAVRKWVADGHLVAQTKTRGPRGSVMWWFYTSLVDAAAARSGKRPARAGAAGRA
ncbi:hypothetical protein J2X03_003802 [Microbacterium trichothecenolyticum]|uniref:hypothetical protein n=1 Tax=Microbacterium trichothecenolyticum TaxID=69370 RepID=UPI0028658E23|nr:hypothetical protein [Microbacterium trichothecenolyticum]MDR7113900.1 hypothetical protein [Microbacterium trichothecenolyticum]